MRDVDLVVSVAHVGAVILSHSASIRNKTVLMKKTARFVQLDPI
jgi:hypothetical protein